MIAKSAEAAMFLTIVIAFSTSAVHAEDLGAPGNIDLQNDPTFLQWQSLPEEPAMREACSNELLYGHAIDDARLRGATLASLLRWAEQEAERSASQAPPNTPLFPIGTDLMLTKLIQASYLDEPIYKLIPGGFAQFAFRSCLKEHSIDR
jgi:hypothetical protein